MQVTSVIKNKIHQIELGEPFTNVRFLKLGSRAAVDQSLSRLVKQGVIQRVARGVYVRPKQNRFIGSVTPAVSDVIEAIAKEHGETVQLHGAEAARRFKLTMQVPTIPVYYTSGSARVIKVGNLKVKLMHTNSRRKLQCAGKKPGLALSALWYLGAKNLTLEAIERVRKGLTEGEFETLCGLDMPAWMKDKIEVYTSEALNA